ncbi:MAG: TlpA family protein disulfide reductase [Marinifilaceae bacterium]|nr:TlpA family protein disulfide reductase [Marinifilaceae bacterium]
MKRIISVSILLMICLSIFGQNSKVKIEGKLKQVNSEKSIRLLLFNGNLSSRTKTLTVKNGKFFYRSNSNFNIGILAASKGYSYVAINSEPINIQIDNTKKKPIIFIGSNKKNQIYLNQFIELVNKLDPFKNIKACSKGYKELDKYIQNIKKKSKKIIKKVSNKSQKEWMETYLRANVFNYKIFYCSLNENSEFLKRIKSFAKDLTINKQYIPFHFIAKEKFTLNDKYLGICSDDIEMFISAMWNQINNSKNCSKILKKIGNNTYYKNKKTKPTINAKTYLDILSNINNKDNYKEIALMSYMKYGRYSKDWKEFIDVTSKKIKDKTVIKSMKDQYSKRKKAKEYMENITKLPAASFICKDINNKNVKLSDFKGKYILVDFWATWCGPCRGELPFLGKKEEEFKNSNIVFLSISMDKNTKAWRTFVKKNKLKGIQIIAGKEHKNISKHYGIKGIPQFMLLGKDGKIIVPNFVRPSNPAFSKILKSFINR